MSNRDFDENELMKDIDGLGNTEASGSAITPAGEEALTSTDDAEQKTGKAKRKPRKTVFTAKQVVLIAVLAAVAVLAIGTTVICTIINVNPVSYIAGELNQSKLVNKWQSQTAPGLTAYEFFDDGTYTSYLSTFTFDGEYEVSGDIITLKNASSNQTVTYKYSILGDTLTLTLMNQNGSEMEGREPSKFDRVDTFNQKSFQDLIDRYRAESEESTDGEAS